MLPLSRSPFACVPIRICHISPHIALDELIHFVGPWTRVEKDVLYRAISRLQTPPDELTVLLGKPWVCTCEVIGSRRLFAASRLAGGPRVFSAYTAEVLASQVASLESEVV